MHLFYNFIDSFLKDLQHITLAKTIFGTDKSKFVLYSIFKSETGDVIKNGISRQIFQFYNFKDPCYVLFFNIKETICNVKKQTYIHTEPINNESSTRTSEQHFNYRRNCLCPHTISMQLKPFEDVVVCGNPYKILRVQ